MNIYKNVIIPGSANKPIALDIFFEQPHQRKPVVIYAHGFNGFKDWGHFDLVAKKIAKEGYVQVKFNFSHNGTSPQQPDNFVDLEAFGNNNYTRQLEDLGLVINWICDQGNPYQPVIDQTSICLIGHSMGGGIAILKAAEDRRVNRLITWAGICECKTPWGSWSADKMLEWKETGVQYYTNSRTGQHMPLYYQLYEDYKNNQQRLDIKRAIQKLSIPLLICHGSLDAAVPVSCAHQLKAWQPNAALLIVESDHVFGRRHPWMDNSLPPAMQTVVDRSLLFIHESVS